MSSSTVTFLGAAGTVTGSRFLVRSSGRRLLVDCGLYQGERDLRRRNWQPFPVDPASLDAVVLSHAHLDHCGYLPALVKEGFAGPVWATPGTAALAAIVLRDSAHLQEEDAAVARAGGYSKHDPPMPLYDAADAENALRLFQPVGFGQPVAVGGDVAFSLSRAGHILGSSSVRVTTSGGTALFSGDLGRAAHPLLRAREDPPAADTVVVESTYGDRRHPSPEVGHEAFADAVRRTISRGGSVLVPAFAVDRTQIVLHELGVMQRAGRIPQVPIYVDSPMGLAAIDVYRRPDLAAELRPDARDWFDAVPAVHEARTPEESMRLNQPGTSCIIVSASGMASGGRVVHHLAHMLGERRHCVVLTGYQAIGTRGRALVDGARQIKVHGRYVPVRAEVVMDDEFSVHADADDVVAWLRRLPEPPSTVYVVHGEREASRALAERVRDELDWCAVVPELGEVVRLA
ncbi:MAG TPA: MBL fold metallo-hydrolase [Actinomycetales bacterium]|nr:MBL fold metallo-hydrolase [Actinomycetales bacterium]